MGVTTRPDTRNLFAVTDSMDVATLALLFAEDAQVVFGNNQPLVGVDEIRTGLTAFFKTIAGLHHEVVNTWNVGDDAINELKVTTTVRMANKSPSHASRSSTPMPPARSTPIASTSTWRPSIPDRA